MESSTSSIPPVSNSNSNSNSSAIQSVSPHLPDISTKLASTNYLLWKAQVVPVLRGNGLLGYVKNQIVCPAQTITSEGGVSQTNPAATTWLRTDQLILGWINSSLTDGPLSQVINCESSHDAWQVLETLYGSHTRDRLQQMKSELQSLNKGSSSLEDYLHKAKSLALSLRGVGKAMDEDELIICILRGLGSEFDPIVAALNARDVYPSLEGVIGKLRDFEIRIQAARVVSSNVAFYTNRGRTSTRSRGTQGFCGRHTTPNQINSQYQQRDVRSTRSTKASPDLSSEPIAPLSHRAMS
uniref:Retrotransposon Copia-like N-terminal domain-containing protein n=1 Tax=Salix viminalis TaxID=40686 RepID=A0A6N2LGN1_SALVM